jgi:hypothetical protein
LQLHLPHSWSCDADPGWLSKAEKGTFEKRLRIERGKRESLAAVEVLKGRCCDFAAFLIQLEWGHLYSFHVRVKHDSDTGEAAPSSISPKKNDSFSSSAQAAASSLSLHLRPMLEEHSRQRSSSYSRAEGHKREAGSYKQKALNGWDGFAHGAH